MNSKRRPSMDPEARMQQLINLSVNLAEKQLEEGTASSQIITHYLKMATPMAQLERQQLEEEIKLLKAKTEALESEEEENNLYKEVIRALHDYRGGDD